MERFSVAPREDWQAIVESEGLLWHSADGQLYWDERGYYSFTLSQIEAIEDAAVELYRLFLEAGERIVGDATLLDLFGIPEYCHPAIAAAWRGGAPALDYGRFDFGYDGYGDPKLFEFNCDTPTSMLETAVIQWTWKEQVFPELDQFNSLHEKLIDRWATIAPQLPGGRVWFTHTADPAHEDTITTTYMRDLAAQAGLETYGVVIDDIGLDAAGRAVDGEDRLISAIFKLYPWEWIVAERYGPDIIRRLPESAWIEPIWKMIWSNKAILPLLSDMFPGHPNLLPAAWRADDVGPSFIAKPILAREGANIAVVERGQTIASTSGAYRDGGIVYQQFYRLRDYGNGYPVLGCWIVDGEPAGLGIREDGLITGNSARFIPHVIRG